LIWLVGDVEINLDPAVSKVGNGRVQPAFTDVAPGADNVREDFNAHRCHDRGDDE
jgi:hypothetical protein